MNPRDALARCVAALEARFDDVAATRMRGLPLLHPGLRVQAVGFEPLDDAGDVALGVLVTPWFMNLVCLPLQAPAQAAMPSPGQDAPRRIGGQDLGFIGAHDDVLGRYATCSLFSPMFDFHDQAAALATAREVLALLRPAPASPGPAVVAATAPVPARRGFLFGRSAAAGAAR